MSSKILLIENDPAIVVALKGMAAENGHFLEVVPNGTSALQAIPREWNLIILSHPNFDVHTESLLSFIKQEPSYPPVMILSADKKLETKLSFFRQGCDDFLSRPFFPEELVLRARALLRRKHIKLSGRVCSYKDLKLDVQTLCLSCPAGTVVLTAKQAAICEMLISNAEELVTKRQILQSIWGLNREPNTNFLEVHLFHLRKKLQNLDRGAWLHRQKVRGFTLKSPFFEDKHQTHGVIGGIRV